MPRKVKLTLELERPNDNPASAIVWFDSSGNSVFEAGERIALATADGNQWVAELDLPNKPSVSALFLVRFTAPVGTKWSCRITRSDGSEAYTTGDKKLKTYRFLTQLAGEVA